MEAKNANYKNTTKTGTKRPSRKNLIKTNFSKGTRKEIADAIQETLISMPFRKFSIPLYAYIHDIFEDEPESNKVIQVGFVKAYNSREKTFHVMTYVNYKEQVRAAIKNPEILVDYVTYEEKFAKINRLIIVNSAR